MQETTPELLSTEQDRIRDADGKLLPGAKINPTGKGGFVDNPENINAGGRPKNPESFTYWMNLFKKMSLIDFKLARENYDGDEWTVAAEAAYVRVEASLGKELANFEAVADRTEGKAPQTVIHEGGIFTDTKVEFLIVDAPTDTPQQETTVDTSAA